MGSFERIEVGPATDDINRISNLSIGLAGITGA